MQGMKHEDRFMQSFPNSLQLLQNRYVPDNCSRHIFTCGRCQRGDLFVPLNERVFCTILFSYMLLYTSAMLLWVSTDVLSNEIPLFTLGCKSFQRCIALIMALPFAHIE